MKILFTFAITLVSLMPNSAIAQKALTAQPDVACKTPPCQVTVTIVWPAPASIGYGTPLSSTQLDATASVPGTFSYSPAAGTVLPVGANALGLTFTPTDTTNYLIARATNTITVTGATPVITWPTPTAITYGTSLSATQLDATASVAGTFVYNPASGTVPAAGTNALSVTFTPTDTTDYTMATASVNLAVGQATPVMTWAAPVAITYGTALSTAQLDATASVAGTFVYNPASGTVPAAGTDALSVTFTPNNTTDYTTATASVNLAVGQAPPVITWAAPAAITYGTALSATQLDATASVPGTFVFSPASGTVPVAGTDTLSVTFTPTNTTDYATVTSTVALTVNKATPTITWGTPAAIGYGTALSATQLNATASVPGTFVYSPASGTVPTVGTDTLSVTFTPTNATDYATATSTVALTVNKATPVITWPTPAAIASGTALSATQLDATASVPGTFVYSPPSGTVPATGTDTLSVMFTPTNTTDYNGAVDSVSLTVGATTPVITWPTPSAITYGTALSAIQLNATASVAGTFAYSPASGTVPTAGTNTLSVTFTPTNTTAYKTATSSVTLTVNKATPVIAWATPAPIANGTALSSTQLDASISVAPNTSISTPTSVQSVPTIALSNAPLSAGVLQSCTTYYNPAPTAGQSLTFLIFNANGGGSYTIANSFTVTAAASSGSQTFTSPPITITAGQVVGYWAASGTEPEYGGQAVGGYYLANQPTLPSGPMTYSSYNGGYPVSCVVTPNIVVSNTSISAPGNVQSVPAIVLSMAPLSAGVLQSCTTYYNQAPTAGQSLTFVIFNANGSGSYTIANSFTVTAAASSGLQAFTSPPIAVTAGQVVGYWAASGTEPGYGGQAVGGYYRNAQTALPSGPQTYSSYGGGYPVSCNVAAGQFAYSPPAGTIPTGGTDTLSVTFTPNNTTDYATAAKSVNLTVSQITPTVTWPTPTAIAYGTALSATQLDATASVQGTFAYSPAAGTVPATGTDTLSVTFTPTSSAYATVIKTVSLTVLSQISDTGTVTLTVGGVTAATTTYAAGATPNSIASGLANGVTLGSFVNVTAVNDGLYLVAKQAGAGTNYSYSVQTTSYDSTDFSQPSFADPVISGSLDGGANADSTGQSQPIYSIAGVSPSSGIQYDGVGNVISYSDSVMGNWTYTYDSLNRLESGSPSSGVYSNQYFCWSYDSFGNRLAETLQTTPCPTTESSVQALAQYNTANQITNDSGIGAAAGYNFNGRTYQYDPAGNVQSDTANQYLYDAEGRICAVQSIAIGNSMIGYLYDADGMRVAKGSISTMSCDPNINHFVTISDYILGPSNEQFTELDMDSNGAMAWQHTNIWAGGKLLGTYDVDGTHFYLDDPLGTRRAQTDYAGVLERTCQSLPYGNSESCPPTPTEHLFTGKERDIESGLDYFGKRYYGSSMGRWTSPDLVNVTEERMMNPSSTLNKYVYGGNNPLKYVDPDGQDITYFYDQSGIAGHAVLFAYNQANGNSAIESFGPASKSFGYRAAEIVSSVPGTSMFDMNVPQSADDLRKTYASVTIQTTPELTQQVIDYMKANPDPSRWDFMGPNCSSEVWKILKQFKLDRQGFHGNQGITPNVLWTNMMARYNPSQAIWGQMTKPTNGRDYGNPRFDMFNLMWNSLPQSHEKVTVTIRTTDGQTVQ